MRYLELFKLHNGRQKTLYPSQKQQSYACFVYLSVYVNMYINAFTYMHT